MNKSYVTGCDVYTYGLDCKSCGNCSGGVRCNHVTGTCPHGCDPGMHGDKCDKGNTSKYELFSNSCFPYKSTNGPSCPSDETDIPGYNRSGTIKIPPSSTVMSSKQRFFWKW